MGIWGDDVVQMKPAKEEPVPVSPSGGFWGKDVLVTKNVQTEGPAGEIAPVQTEIPPEPANVPADMSMDDIATFDTSPLTEGIPELQDVGISKSASLTNVPISMQGPLVVDLPKTEPGDKGKIGVVEGFRRLSERQLGIKGGNTFAIHAKKFLPGAALQNRWDWTRIEKYGNPEGGRKNLDGLGGIKVRDLYRRTKNTTLKEAWKAYRAGTIRDDIFSALNDRINVRDSYNQEAQQRGESHLFSGIRGAEDMVGYMERIAEGPIPFIAFESLVRFEEGKVEGAGNIEALTKAVGGATASYAIEKAPIPKSVKKLVPKGVRSRFRLFSRKAGKLVPRHPIWNAVNSASGLNSLPREIIGEEGAEQFVTSLFNLNYDYEHGKVPPWTTRLSDGAKSFVDAVPDMAISMIIMKGGQRASSIPMYLADNIRVTRGLDALGVSEKEIAGMTFTEKVKRLKVEIDKQVSPEDVTIAEAFVDGARDLKDKPTKQPAVPAIRQEGLDEPGSGPLPPGTVPTVVPEPAPLPVSPEQATEKQAQEAVPAAAEQAVAPQEAPAATQEAVVPPEAVQEPVSRKKIVRDPNTGKIVSITITPATIKDSEPLLPAKTETAEKVEEIADLKDAFDKYDDTGESTVEDLVSEVQGIAEDMSGPQASELLGAVELFLSDAEQDLKEHGLRGDVEGRETAFIDTIKKVLSKTGQPDTSSIPYPTPKTPYASKKAEADAVKERDEQMAKEKAPDLKLESVSKGQLEAETAKQTRKEAIADAQAKPLEGRAVDTTGDLFDATKTEAPLFAAPTPKKFANWPKSPYTPELLKKNGGNTNKAQWEWAQQFKGDSEAMQEMARKAEEAHQEVKRLEKEGKFQEGVDASVNVQLWKESIEAAEGKPLTPSKRADIIKPEEIKESPDEPAVKKPDAGRKETPKKAPQSDRKTGVRVKGDKAKTSRVAKPTASKPATVEAKKGTPSKYEKEIQEKIRKHFAPGNIVFVSYNGTFDKVLDYQVPQNKVFEVTVVKVEKSGGKWVEVERKRTHSTPPSPQDRIEVSAFSASKAKPAEKKLSVPEALHKGEPVKAPRGSTWIRATDMAGNKAEVPLKDADTLQGAGPWKTIEYGTRGIRGKQKDAFLPLKGTAPLDINKKGRELELGGFVSAPSQAGIGRLGKSLKGWIKRNFTPSMNRTAAERAYAEEKEFNASARVAAGRWASNVFRSARQSLTKKYGRDNVQSSLKDVLYGDMTIDEFRTEYDLEADDKIIKELTQFQNERKVYSKVIAAELRKAGNEELASRIEENEHYVNRFYLKHTMGDQYSPKPEDMDLAVAQVRAGLEDSLKTLATRLTKAQGKKIKTDLMEYIQNRDPAVLAGLSKTRAALFDSAARLYDKLDQVVGGINWVENTAEVSANQEALMDSAQSIVNSYLQDAEKAGLGSGRAEGALKKRFLEGAFRNLYGEIDDPIFASGRTAEIQHTLAANLVMVNSMMENGKGTIWTEIQSEKAGTMHKMPDDPKRFGMLAGKYVTKEVSDTLITKDGAPVFKTWMNIVGTQRLLKLIGPKTIGRNYLTAYFGFALGSGDAYRPSYYANLKKAHGLGLRFLRGETDAIKELQGLIEQGVFSFHGDSQLGEVKNLLSLKGKPKKALDKAGEWYAMIDMPTKVASYWTAKDRGLSDAEAGEHVRKHYQNPFRVIPAVKMLAKLPLTDFPGYFYDSVRIRGNQIRSAFEGVKKGDITPLLGLASAVGLQIFMMSVFGDMRKGLWEIIKKRLGKDEKIKDVVEITGIRQQAMRSFMPVYYKNAPMKAWEQTRDGKKEVVFTVLEGNSAFPLDDMIWGAAQASQGDPKDFAKRFASSLRDDFLAGSMQADALYTLATGDALPTKGSTYQTIGPIEAMRDKDPRTFRIIKDSVIRYISDTYGGQVGSKLEQSWSLAEKDKAGQQPTAGSYTPYQSHKQIWGSLFDPARTYTIDKREARRILRNSLVKYQARIAATTSMVGAEERARRRLGAPLERQTQEAKEAQIDRMRYMKDLQKTIADARQAFGGLLSEPEIFAATKDAIKALRTYEVAAVLKGKVDTLPRYVPNYRPSYMERVVGGRK